MLEAIGAGAIGIAAAGAALLTGQFLSPNVLFEPAASFKVGTPDLYAPDSVTFDAAHNVFVVRAPEGYFYALSAVCTHLGCVVNYKADQKIIACPCHGSKFDTAGNVLHGPAPQPLQHFSVSINEHGLIVIDKSQIVAPGTVLKV